MSYRPKLIGRMAFDYSGYLGPIKEFKPKPAKFCGLVEDAAPPLTKPLPFTKPTKPLPFTKTAKPKDFLVMDVDVEEAIPADSALMKKLIGYFEQKGASAADMEDFIRLWDRIHKPNQAMDRLRRAFDASTTASIARMFPDYNRLGK